MREILIKAVGLHQRGQVAEAERLYRQVLAAAPRNADALRLCGIACSQQGKPEEALALLEKAAKAAPTSADTNNALGKVLNDLGRFEEGAKKCHLAIRANPQLAEAHDNLGNALLALERYEEAEAAYRKALALTPKNPQFHNNLGGALAAMGRYEEAAPAFQEALRLKPAFASALRNLGNTCRYMLRIEDMLAAYEKALALQGRTPQALLDYAIALIDAERAPDAVPLLEEALEQHPDWPSLRLRQVEALMEVNRAGEGAAILEETLPHLPEDVNTALRVGRIYSRLGRFEEAVDWLNRAVELDPDDARALYSLSNINRLGAEGEAFSNAKRLADDASQSTMNRTQAAFAAAQALDAAKSYDEAFAYFRLGNDLTPKGKIDWDMRDKKLALLLEVFTPAFYDALEAGRSQDDTPIFVVGMPRSGTTLTERIMARHPSVAGAGELTAITDGLRDLGMTPNGSNFPAFLENLTPEQVAEAAQAYLEKLRAVGGSEARHIVDKLPGNALYIGYIHLLFPKARIIHCSRDPLDVGLSCYKANFTRLTWAFSLEGIARQSFLHAESMRHWRALLPGLVFDLPYEALVADPETWTPKLIEAAGLPWDQTCLGDDSATASQVKTASIWQARQPINTRSVKGWTRYAEGLEPLRSRLTELGVISNGAD